MTFDQSPLYAYALHSVAWAVMLSLSSHKETGMCGRYKTENSKKMDGIIGKMQASPLVSRWNRTAKVCTGGEIRPDSDPNELLKEALNDI